MRASSVPLVRRTRPRHILSILGVLFAAALLLLSCATTHIGIAPPPSDASVDSDEAFVNPILPLGADPTVIFHEGSYYYCTSDGRATIFLAKAADFTRLGETQLIPVYTAPEGTEYSQHIWAPEIHNFDGDWYIYFSADDGEIFHHQVFTLKSVGDDPVGEYEFFGGGAPEINSYSIDGTVWRSRDGEYYFFWSGWRTTRRGAQHILVAPMEGPARVSGEPVVIATPEYYWETPWLHPPVNEGPQILENEQWVHIVYSANVFWSSRYSLGLLTMAQGDDPLDPDSWRKHSWPVFKQANGIRGPGHASFTVSPDGTEYWIIYHALIDDREDNARMIRAQQFIWDEKGYPVFQQPVPPGSYLTRPAVVE